MLPPRPDPAPGCLVDPQGRRVTYLRLSLTERCNLRCSYCSPAARERRGGSSPLDRAEIARLVTALAQLGIRRVRLTGGEPTLRPDLLDIARDVRSTPGIEEVALTTNGILLERLAPAMRRAGVSRLNVSLDTLRPDRLSRLARRGGSFERVIRGVDAAARAGFASLKTNTVVIRGVNDRELADLARFAWRRGAVARFIELMPFGEGEPVPTAEVTRLLEAQGVTLTADATTRGWGPARYMRGQSSDAGGPVSGVVGFIGAMTEGFCATCNRIRVGPDGALRACLGGRDRVPLRDLLAAQPDATELAARVHRALAGKLPRHQMAAGRPKGGFDAMAGIGG